MGRNDKMMKNYERKRGKGETKINKQKQNDEL